MRFKLKKDKIEESKNIGNKKQVHLAIVNDSIITTESIELALKRMDEEKTNIHIASQERIPFLRNLMIFIQKYKLDLIIMDAQLEKQNVFLYIEKIKNYDKNIKIIVLAKIITPELESFYDKSLIDEYTTLPFQDANLWRAMHKSFYVEQEHSLMDVKEVVSQKPNKPVIEVILEDDSINPIEDDMVFTLGDKEETINRTPSKGINVFEYAKTHNGKI